MTAPQDAVSRTQGVPPGDEQGGSRGITPAEKDLGLDSFSARMAAAKRAHELATGFRIGDRVITNTPGAPRFHDRHGRVTATNLGEVGLSFTKSDLTVAWFLPAELRRSS